MNKSKEHIEELKDRIESLHWKNLRLRQEVSRRETALLHIMACAAVGHTFKLTSAFINREKGNRRYGRFECTNCYLKIKRPLTTQEETAAQKLGMVS